MTDSKEEKVEFGASPFYAVVDGLPQSHGWFPIDLAYTYTVTRKKKEKPMPEILPGMRVKHDANYFCNAGFATVVAVQSTAISFFTPNTANLRWINKCLIVEIYNHYGELVWSKGEA
jgi:hypothetical protein